MSDRDFDVAVLGATGVTGQRICRELGRVQHESRAFAWAAAGRNAGRVRRALEANGVDDKVAEIVVADAMDADSLLALCRRTRVLINAVGPFRFTGRNVVDACIAGGAHYVDITGEPDFMERTEAECHEAAEEAGVLVVPASGFDSVPADMGTVYAVSNFPGQAHTVRSYMSVRGGPAGVVFNATTCESAVEGLGAVADLRALRKKAPERMKFRPEMYGPRPRVPTGMVWVPSQHAYALPFPGSDASVVRRSQRLLVQKQLEDGTSEPKPVHYTAQMCFYPRMHAIGVIFIGLMLQFFARWAWGRKLLIAFPRLFSCGLFRRGGPTPEQRDATSLVMTFETTGFKEPVDTPGEHADAEATTQVTRITTPEPGYDATPIIVVQSALAVLQERDRIPYKGGVLTTAAAFRETSLIERLQQNGLEFEVVDE